jgi:hypothetical protein
MTFVQAEHMAPERDFGCAQSDGNGWAQANMKLRQRLNATLTRRGQFEKGSRERAAKESLMRLPTRILREALQLLLNPSNNPFTLTFLPNQDP